MEKKLRFIHTADIHLGSILHFTRKTGRSLTDIRNNAVYNSFSKVCDTAIREKVDFILISGDIYDKEARSVKGNSFFINECRRLQNNNIKVFVIGGNHDPISEDNELFSLPDNVIIFGSQKPEIYEFKDEDGKTYCRIIGQSYRSNWDSRKMYSNYNLPKDNALNIALLHTELDNSNNYVPCLPSDLKAIEKIHYWALGHIHKHKIVDTNPFIVYPGIPQGRDFGEEGCGGFVLVQATGTKIDKVDFIHVSDILWEKKDIDITGEESIKNIGDLEDFLFSKCEELEENIKKHLVCIKGIAARLTITGRGEIYNLVNGREEEVKEYLIENLNSKLINNNPFIYIDFIEINIRRPAEELDMLVKNNEIFEEISKTVLECLNDDNFIKKLGAVWEKTKAVEDINVKKIQLNDEFLKRIVKQIENIVTDAILESGEGQ